MDAQPPAVVGADRQHALDDDAPETKHEVELRGRAGHVRNACLYMGIAAAGAFALWAAARRGGVGLDADVTGVLIAIVLVFVFVAGLRFFSHRVAGATMRAEAVVRQASIEAVGRRRQLDRLVEARVRQEMKHPGVMRRLRPERVSRFKAVEASWHVDKMAGPARKSDAKQAIAAMGSSLVEALERRRIEDRVRPGFEKEERLRLDAEARGPQEGLVICCSGGGIKSGSFCMGGLQALWAAGLYENADKLVAVSGGGYAAAAYAAAQTRGGDGNPFALGSPELATLRRRTNYLAASPRVRFELVNSLLLGLFINVMVFALLGVILVWLLAGYALGLELGLAHKPFKIPPEAEGCVVTQVRPYCVDWDFGGIEPWSWAWAASPAGLLLVIVLGMFLANRFAANVPTWAPRWASRSSVSWWTNAPNLVAGLAVAWLAVVPLAIWLAIALHNVWFQRPEIAKALGGQLTAIVGAASFGTVATLVVSTLTGLRKEPDRRTFAGNLRATFREWVAPRAALAGVAAIALAVCSSVLSYAMTDDAWLNPRMPGAWHWPVGAGVALILLVLVVNANSTSLHLFYRERLSHAYLTYGDGDGDGDEIRAYSRPLTQLAPGGVNALPLRASWRTGLLAARGRKLLDWLRRSPPVVIRPGLVDALPDRAGGGPRLVMCATANVEDDELVPTGRNGSPFIFSAAAIGLSDRRTPFDAFSASSSAYGKRGGRPVTLSQAVATSGAAVAPVSGRDKRMRPYRPLFALVNIRLGVWFPSPAWNEERDYRGWWKRRLMKLDQALNKPSGLQVFQEGFGKLSIYSSWLYVTDGGHYDNLGLVESLRGRPRRIILLDGSGDSEDQFPAMGQALATARMDLGVEITFDPSPLTKGGNEYPQAGHVVATARWLEDGHMCRIDYIKCVMPRGMPWDVRAYKLLHPDFPATSTSLEMYDEFDFEAYRELGYRLVTQAGL